MAFQPVPNVFLAIPEFGVESLQWTNTWYFFTLLRGEERMQLCADLLHQEIGSELMPLLAQDWYLRHVTVYDLTDQFTEAIVDAETPVQGAQVADPLSVINSMVVTLRSDIRGRSGRGRHYVCGFTEAQGGSASFVNQALADDVELAYETIAATMATNQFLHSIVQRWQNSIKLEEGQEHPIQQYDVRNLTYGAQRRRVSRM